MCDISQSQETLSIYSWGLFLLNESSAFNVQISGRNVVCGARIEQLETPGTVCLQPCHGWEVCLGGQLVTYPKPSAQTLL